MNSIQKSIDQIDKFLGIGRGLKTTKALSDKARVSLSDIRSGEIYRSDESFKNLIDVINDIFKGSIIGTGYILIPGSLILIPLIRKRLQKSKIEKIRKLLELTVDDKN